MKVWWRHRHTHAHSESSSGLCCLMCDGWTLTDVPQSRRLSAYTSMTLCHPCSKPPARSDLINSTQSWVGADKTWAWHSAPASQFEMFALKTRTTEALRIWIVKGSKCLCFQIPGDLSVISQKGGEVWSVEKIPAAMPPQAFPKYTREQIKKENKLLSNVFPTPQRRAGRNGSVNVFISDSDTYLRRLISHLCLPKSGSRSRSR